MPTPIEQNTAALQELKGKAEGLPDKTPPVKLQEKMVSPSTVVQEVMPDSEFDALSKVTVDGYVDYSTDLKGIVDGTATAIKLPEGLTSIKKYAFYDCTNLVLTELPPGPTSIGDYAFYNCIKLGLTSLPEGITSIGSNAFYYCRVPLTSLPDSLTSIGSRAFREVVGLNLTLLPDSLTSIGSEAFYGCMSFKKIWIPKGCKTISASNTLSGPFNFCTSLTDIYTDASSKLSGWGTYWNYTHIDSQATVHYNVSKAEFEALL